MLDTANLSESSLILHQRGETVMNASADQIRKNSSPVDLLSLSRAELTTLLKSWEFSSSHAARLWRYLYREGVEGPEGMNDLPARLRNRLSDETSQNGMTIRKQAVSIDGFTRKFLLGLPEGLEIESVLMRFSGRVTACISSQAGCAMGCVFCATGQMGFRRHLSAGQIVAQVLHLDRVLRSADSAVSLPGRGARTERLRNVVLMGMGEPLHNYEAVLKAVGILCDSAGLAISPKRMTLSTVGVVPGIIRLADEGQPVRLAVSLHAATQEERAALISVAKAWPLDALLEACRYYVFKLDQRIFFEWALIAGRNDSPDQAKALARLLRGIPAHVNLIPLNPTAEYAGVPSEETSARRFQAVLVNEGLPCTIRQRRGIDIAAGCGQLAAREG